MLTYRIHLTIFSFNASLAQWDNLEGFVWSPNNHNYMQSD